MLVGDWMFKNVTTVTEDVSMLKASRIMREKKIRRLPVVDKAGKLTGIVSERDLKAASPSSATTLDMYEMTYLLSEMRVKGIMTRDPVSIRPSDTVERAALIMRDRKIGSLPVVDESGKVVGIITDTDIFRLFVSITGIDQVLTDFSTPREPIELALSQEKQVTAQVEALFRAARHEDDALGEQFMMWFLKEQVEEVASMNSLLTITERAGNDWFQIEEHLAREPQADPDDNSAPEAAGGAL